jgi:hypothetical protein
MSNTRREFLESGAALAVGVMAGLTTKTLAAQTATASQAGNSLPAAQPPASEIQVPKMKFGKAEISRLVLGVNPLYGFAHFNRNFGSAMRDWYTQDKVCEVLHRANAFGINAFNYVNMGRAPQDLARFQAEGGKMHLIVQATAADDPAALVQSRWRSSGEARRSTPPSTMEPWPARGSGASVCGSWASWSAWAPTIPRSSI